MAIEKEVQISLKLVSDKGNVKAAKAVQAAVTSAVQAGATAEAKAVATVDKQWEKVTRNRLKLLAQIQQAEQRKAKEAERAAERQVRADEKQAKASAAAADRAARDRRRSEEKAERERLRAVAVAQQAEAKAVAVAERNRERQAKAAERAAAQERRELQTLQATAAAAAESRIDNEVRVVEASKKTLQGTLDVAEGLAKVGLLSQDNLEKFVRSFVMVQEGFRALRGGLDIMTGLVEATRAYQKATQAAAVAQTALAGAQALGARTGAAGGGSSAVSTATSVGAGAVGAKVATGGLVASLKTAAASVGAFTAKVVTNFAPAAAAAALVGEGFSRLYKLVGLTSESLGESIFGGRGILAAWKAQTKASERLARAEAELASKREAAAVRDDRIVSAAQAAAASRAEAGGIAGALDEARGLGDLERARRARLRAASEAEQAEGGIQAAAGRNAQRQQAGDIFSYADQITSLERLKAARQEMVAADKLTVDLLKQQVQERKRSVDVASQEVARAKELVQAETGRIASATARFGRLDRVQQDRLREISAAGGPRSAEEARFLESTGIGTGRAESFFEQQGRSAGAEGVLSGLGELDGLRQAQTAQQQAVEAVNAAKREELKATQDLTAASQTLVQSLEKLPEILRQIAEANAGQQGFSDENTQRITSGFEALTETIVEAVEDANRAVKKSREQAAANQV